MSSITAVIDYGMGNLHSVQSALVKAGASDVVVTSDLALIEAADRVVFPGVGAIKDCLSEFRGLGCEPVLKAVISRGTPVLAICVGMQSLMTHSEENGGVDALDVFNGTVRLFDKSAKAVSGAQLKCPIWDGIQSLNCHPTLCGTEFPINRISISCTAISCLAQNAATRSRRLTTGLRQPQ